jgi:type II secretory pathway component GspD/PulD (secretin)
VIKIFGALCLFVGSSAFASTNAYDLKMELSLNGRPLSSPHLVVKEGEKASILQDSNGEKTFVDVVTTEKMMDGERVVFMDFKIGTISATGERKVIASPQITTFENEKAKISVGEDGKEDVSLSVVATRKTL